MGLEAEVVESAETSRLGQSLRDSRSRKRRAGSAGAIRVDRETDDRAGTADEVAVGATEVPERGSGAAASATANTVA